MKIELSSHGTIPPPADISDALKKWIVDSNAGEERFRRAIQREVDGIVKRFSWTPTLTFVIPGTLSVSYTTRNGLGMRLGNLVALWANIVTSAFTLGTASGALKVTGVPIGSESAALVNYIGALSFQGITKAGYTQFVPQVTNAGFVQFVASGSGQVQATVDTTYTPSGGSVILQFFVLYQF